MIEWKPSTRSVLSTIKASQLIVSKVFFALPILHQYDILLIHRCLAGRESGKDAFKNVI